MGAMRMLIPEGMIQPLVYGLDIRVLLKQRCYMRPLRGAFVLFGFFRFLLCFFNHGKIELLLG